MPVCEHHWHCDPKLASHNCPLDTDRLKPCPACNDHPEAARVALVKHEIGIMGTGISVRYRVELPDDWETHVADAILRADPLIEVWEVDMPLVVKYLRQELGVELPA